MLLVMIPVNRRLLVVKFLGNSDFQLYGVSIPNSYFGEGSTVYLRTLSLSFFIGTNVQFEKWWTIQIKIFLYITNRYQFFFHILFWFGDIALGTEAWVWNTFIKIKSTSAKCVVKMQCPLKIRKYLIALDAFCLCDFPSPFLRIK